MTENKEKAYNISRDYKDVKQFIKALNHNTKCDNENLIPIVFYKDSLNIWNIRPLYKEDIERFEKHYNFIYDL